MDQFFRPAASLRIISTGARQLPDVIFGSNVTVVDYDPETNGLVIDAESGQERTRYTSRHIVSDCGSTPESTIANSKGARVVHVSDLLTIEFPEPLRSVLIVGRGQSGAEYVNFLLDHFAEVEVQITWVTHETAQPSHLLMGPASDHQGASL